MCHGTANQATVPRIASTIANSIAIRGPLDFFTGAVDSPAGASVKSAPQYGHTSVA
jgi:hypothetical protein